MMKYLAICWYVPSVIRFAFFLLFSSFCLRHHSLLPSPQSSYPRNTRVDGVGLIKACLRLRLYLLKHSFKEGMTETLASHEFHVVLSTLANGRDFYCRRLFHSALAVQRMKMAKGTSSLHDITKWS